MQAGLEQSSVADELIVIGERGARYLSEDQKTAYLFWPAADDEKIGHRARALRDFFVERMKRRQYQSVWAVYPRFVSLGIQIPEVVKLLPCPELFGSRERTVPFGKKRVDPLVEPSMSAVIESLVRMHLAQRLTDILLESKLSEEAARVTHLESSREEIQQARQQQWQEYFKRSHEKSDKNIREIFSGQIQWKHRLPG
jgi:F0F1-type ATP synthase gamma subunit